VGKRGFFVNLQLTTRRTKGPWSQLERIPRDNNKNGPCLFMAMVVHEVDRHSPDCAELVPFVRAYDDDRDDRR